MKFIFGWIYELIISFCVIFKKLFLLIIEDEIGDVLKV